MGTDKNSAIFWDKKTGKEEIVKILKNSSHPRFIEFAALLLSRSNDPKEVFADYLSKGLFAANWLSIKRKMRLNKWNDARIIFWDEIYKVLTKEDEFKQTRRRKARPLDIDPEINNICARIKEIRIKQGLTQKQLALKTGLSQQSISFAEQGYVNISLRTLKKIADSLNLKIFLNER
jgi:DNA-binding XRE family transcriptional regulator